MSIIRYLGASCFWIFSSESLVLIGNSAGYGVWQTAILLLVLAPVFFHGLLVCDEARKRGVAPGAAFGGVGSIFFTIAGFSGIVGTCLFVSTGILVSAGFTFNEVFFYRFPNFGFAFLLLVAGVAVQYLNEEKKEVLIGLLIGGAATCLLILVLMGITTVAQNGESVPNHAANGGFFWPLIFLFLGFEQMSGTAERKLSPKVLGRFFIAMLFLLLVWAAVSSYLVSSEKLANSTIPHMIAAGKIASSSGRFLMGAAIIFSALAVVIRLLSISGTFFMSDGLLSSSPRFRVMTPPLHGIVISVLMFTGVAGHDSIEMMIRASLLLWMAYAGATVAGYWKTGRDQEKPRVPVLLSGGIILAVCFAVFLFQGEYTLNTLYLALFLAGSALCVAVLTAVRKFLTTNNKMEVNT
jgi:hypothetical protein